MSNGIVTHKTSTEPADGSIPSGTVKWWMGSNGHLYSKTEADVVIDMGASTIVYSTFLAMTDTPVTYSGQSGKIPKVNVGETALEFVDDFVSWEEFGGGIRPTENNKIAVGRYDVGANSVFGTGDSHQLGMKVFTYNADTSSWADVSANVITQGDGLYTELPSVNANSCIYVGTSTGAWFTGVRNNITQVLNVGSGEIAREYWNGSAWTEFTIMGTQTNFPYQSIGNSVGSVLGDYQTRFNHQIASNWASTTVNGVASYWVRYRVKTAITQSFRFDFLKLQTNKTKIDANGFVEFFGWARPIKQFFLDYGSFQAAASTPTTQDIYLSDNLDVGRVLNEFSASAIQRTAFTKILPLDLDTSTPLKLRIKWYGENATTGAVRFVIRWGKSVSSMGVFSTAALAPTTATGEQSAIGLITVPTSGDYKEIITDVYLSVSDYIPEIGATNATSIWISLERTGSDASDTYAGVVVVTDIECYYVAWRLGGMVYNY